MHLHWPPCPEDIRTLATGIDDRLLVPLLPRQAVVARMSPYALELEKRYAAPDDWEPPARVKPWPWWQAAWSFAMLWLSSLRTRWVVWRASRAAARFEANYGDRLIPADAIDQLIRANDSLDDATRRGFSSAQEDRLLSLCAQAYKEDIKNLVKLQAEIRAEQAACPDCGLNRRLRFEDVAWDPRWFKVCVCPSNDYSSTVRK